MTPQEQQAFAQGFIEKCAQYGVDPELMSKQAFLPFLLAPMLGNMWHRRNNINMLNQANMQGGPASGIGGGNNVPSGHPLSAFKATGPSTPQGSTVGTQATAQDVKRRLPAPAQGGSSMGDAAKTKGLNIINSGGQPPASGNTAPTYQGIPRLHVPQSTIDNLR